MDETQDPACLPSLPSFSAFYEAVNRRKPFPWQSRLAHVVDRTERWPAEVGVPTGLGKTACLEVAIWWLASQADRLPAERTAPTRIWWIVNRRLLVDSTSAHAECIQMLLREPATASSKGAERDLEAVAARLRSLSADPDAEPLEVVRLRGGVARGRPTDPSQPAVVLSTIPMYGSWLLFRGYGLSRSKRPIDAALAGTDSLVLVDEAHLARHMMSLLPALEECVPQARPLLNLARTAPRVVSLTATGDFGAERFKLDEADETHPEIRKRLDAAKPTEIKVFDAHDPVKPLADAASLLLAKSHPPATCIVFTNTPRTARSVKDQLLKRKAAGLSEDDVLVLTGRTREREAEAARREILGAMAAGQPLEGRSRHLVVIATQTLEVGADIDAEFLVTEACGVRALTQRLGRLNRLGRYPHARAVYVHCPSPPPGRGQKNEGWPVYGSEPEQVLGRLQRAADDSRTAADDSRTVNLAPCRVAEVLGEPGDDPGRAPEILPALLWEWVKTTTPPDAAPVEPYFSGIAQPERSVSLIWRVHVPEQGQRLWPRPAERESVDVPIGEVRAALDDDEQLHRIRPDVMAVEGILPADLRPGDLIVLATDRGLLDSDGWAPDSTGQVPDMSILRHGLPLDSEALQRFCKLPTERAREIQKHVSTVVGERLDSDEEADDEERKAALDRLLEALREHPPTDLTDGDFRESDLTGWDDFISQLDRQLSPVIVRDEVPRLRRPRRDQLAVLDDLDETSLSEASSDLGSHCREVGARARRTAEAVGLSPDLANTVEQAGCFHDIGKADVRFQRWLDPDGKARRPVAKSDLPPSRWSAARVEAGWPRGGRHEELSARLVREQIKEATNQLDQETADLLVHLVVSHHGKGRPLVLPVEDGTLATVSYDPGGVAASSAADLSKVDWTQPSRFRRLNDLYGPWGLALLETIVRQADHAVSAGTGTEAR
ncbi:MAG: type I-U CRISPR-associated helicase/endonuclease Cas3 [Actinomycetia bacterium]|nr:type I-U CRISPR-associated helicase/endonuclease Cas3 [Actinomycetes bacterium]